MTGGCPSKKRRDTHREVGRVKTEEEIGATQLQTKGDKDS